VSLGSDADVANYVGPGAEVVIFQTAKLILPTKSGDGQNKAPANVATSGGDLTMTKTLVAQAAVLAGSQATATAVSGNDGGGNGGGSSTLVTIALSQRDAERVILGQNVGQLYLGLLSASSQVDPNDPGVVNLANNVNP